MKISLENSILAMSEYIAQTFGKNPDPSIFDGFAAIAAHYKLNTQGIRMLKLLSGDSEYIDLDVLESVVKKYLGNMHDTTFNTAIGQIKISADTPAEIMEMLKKYGEN
ncbi:MAG: hypothetical protein IJ479_03390 [Alphaproteobacteria bacterium]|nr:hypothetical protein [Alphaproteobacteria bacterium]